MQPETEADGARRKRAEAETETETETEHEELRTFSNINTLAFVLKLWPGVAQTGLPMPYHHSPHRAFLISSNTCEQPERRHSGLGQAGRQANAL